MRKLFAGSLVLACAMLTSLLLCVAPAAAEPRTRIEGGMLEGVDRDGLRVFLGVPYAAPPVGERRWRGPLPPAHWQGVRTARDFGPSCMQSPVSQGIGPWTPEFFPHNTVSEDCLYLNIWTPSARREARLPVFVWIPGGGFRNGGGAVPLYDGAALAHEGVVVVTLNYRLGAFGFLAHPDLALEADGGRGNYGLRDVIAALEWIQENARAFGGDPQRVTIAGQSAGGALVNALLVAPSAHGLFSRAIVQSSPLGAQLTPDRAAAEDIAARFHTALGISDMRMASADAVLAVSDTMNFRPYVDEVLLLDDPARLLGAGFGANVPMLAGVVEHETRTRLDLAGWRQKRASFGADADEFGRLYPAATDAQALESGLAAERDATLAGLQRWADARVRHVRAPLYLYLWTYAEPGPESATHRAFHSAELVYLFGAFNAAPNRFFTAEDTAISAALRRAWANFARVGDPGGWPPARGQPAQIMELGATFAPITPLAPDKRALFERQFDERGMFTY